MSLYDFSIEEYAEFLKEELAGTNAVPLGIEMMGKPGRKPKNATQVEPLTILDNDKTDPCVTIPILWIRMRTIMSS